MKRISYTRQPLTKTEKLKRLLAYIEKNELVFECDFLLLDGKIYKSIWKENALDWGGSYERVEVTDESISDSVISKAENVYGRHMIKLEEKQKIDKYVWELYREGNDFTI